MFGLINTQNSEECSIRFANNQLLEPDTAGLSMKDFYAYYNSPSKGNVCANAPATYKQHCKTVRGFSHLYVEVYVDQTAVCDFDFSDNNYTQSGAQINLRAEAELERRSEFSLKAKRPRADSVATGPRKSLRRSYLRTGPPTSAFSLSSRSGRATIHEEVAFTGTKLICRVTEDTGECTLATSNSVITGHIARTPFAKGTMKAAHQVKVYVPKNY